MELTKQQLIEKILNTVPALEWNSDPFWKKYGTYYFGIGDGYNWNEIALNKAEEAELWKVLALCSEYWYRFYAELSQKDYSNWQKVFNFTRECRNFIELEDTSYKSNFTMLEKALEFIKNHSENSK
jgi:hypothetical protein